MKMLNKLGLLGIISTACVFNPLNANAATALPTPDESGVVTLTEDVTVSSAISIASNSNVKVIDLAGHTLTRGEYYGYLVNNLSDLTIKNGNVVCNIEPDIASGVKPETKSSSCIRSYGSLNIENVNIDAYWTALKAEEGTTLNIDNSTITSQSGTAGTILNYGDAKIVNSSIKAAAVPNGAAIFTMSYADETGNFGASVLVENSTVEGYWPVLLGKYDQYSDEFGEATSVSFKGENTIISDGGFLRKDTQREDVTLDIAGKITAPAEALNYLEDGSILTLNEDVTEAINVPSGITLVLADGIEITGEGKISFEEGAIIENRSGKDIEVTTVINGEETTVAVPNMTAIGKEDDSNGEVPSEPTDPEEPDVKPIEPSDEDAEPEKNPQTFDGVTVYASTALISVAGLGLVLKKHLN